MSYFFHNHRVQQPSPSYIFVVVAVAMFLTLFMFWRSPGIRYHVEASTEEKLSFPMTDTDIAAMVESKRVKLLSPDFVHRMLQETEMLPVLGENSDLSTRQVEIAHEIAGRMNIACTRHDQFVTTRISMQTTKPAAAQQLLDAISNWVVDSGDGAESTSAQIVGMQGGSLTRLQLIKIGLLSSLAGLFGVYCAHRTRVTGLIESDLDVGELTGVPVLVTFSADPESARARRRVRYGRAMYVGVSIAELAVTAVFLLMTYHSFVSGMFLSRFCRDPLAAYGEMLTRVIG